MGLTAVIMGVVMATAACGSSGGAAETKAADSAASTEAATEAAGGDTSAAGDLNSKTVDELTEAAKSEGEVVSVGMPDEWADWASLWKTMSDTYGISHNDTDMSSSEELQMFATEGEKGTKDMMLVTDSQDRLYLKILFRVTRPPIGTVFLIGQRAKMVSGWLLTQV